MENGIVRDPAIKRLPLSLKRLSSQCIKRIGSALGTPITASTAKVYQMIEAKLEEGHEPRSVQVFWAPSVKPRRSSWKMSLVIFDSGRHINQRES